MAKLQGPCDQDNETASSYLTLLNLENGETHVEKYQTESMIIDKAPFNIESKVNDILKLKKLLPPINNLQHPNANKSLFQEMKLEFT